MAHSVYLLSDTVTANCVNEYKKMIGSSGVGTYLSGTAQAVPLLKVGRLVMNFAVPLFGHRLHIALMIDGRTVLCSRGVYISHCQ